VNGALEMGYPKDDGNGSSSGASTIPKDDLTSAEVFDGAGGGACQIKIPQLDRALAVVREYCAIGSGSKKAGNGRQALEHTRAVRMAI
jgi:hypothetical protein